MSDALSTPIAGPQAWLGADMAASSEWIRPFAPREIDEIDAALRAVQHRALSWPKFGRDEFPLPTFARELAGVLDELEEGRGFVVLRGFPVERYTGAELKDVYWGVGSHLGYPRYQNATGELPEVPRMTAAQDEALDLHAEMCEELCFTMALEPGDWQLLNNHVIYHGRTGAVRGPFSMLLHSPKLAEQMLPIVGFFREDTVVEPKLRLIGILSAVREREAAYVWAAQVGFARRIGLREEVIDLLRAKGDPAALPAEEREIVTYVRQLMRTNRIDQAAFDALRKRHDERWMVELTAAVNYYALLCGMVNAFEVQAPPDGDRLPA